MTRTKWFATVLAGAVLLCILPLGTAAESGALQVGAARVEITPASNALPPPYSSVLDKIWVRALVLDNGIARAAMVTLDGLEVLDDTVIVALANGGSGYLPADMNYDGFGFESTVSKVKRGCAEQSIVNGFVEMMKRH